MADGNVTTQSVLDKNKADIAAETARATATETAINNKLVASAAVVQGDTTPYDPALELTLVDGSKIPVTSIKRLAGEKGVDSMALFPNNTAPTSLRINLMDADVKTVDLNDLLSPERTRAMSAESTLTTKINDDVLAEKTRAMSIEGVLGDIPNFISQTNLALAIADV
jgi:hypothetical protein